MENCKEIKLDTISPNASVVRIDIPPSSYLAKTAIINHLIHALSDGRTIRRAYFYANDAYPNKPKNAYFSLLIEYHGADFELFDGGELYASNPGREAEVIQLAKFVTVFVPQSNVLFSVKRLPCEVREMAPLAAAGLVLGQTFKLVLPDWQEFKATLDQDYELYPSDERLFNELKNLVGWAQNIPYDFAFVAQSDFECFCRSTNLTRLIMGTFWGGSVVFYAIRDRVGRALILERDLAYAFYKEFVKAHWAPYQLFIYGSPLTFVNNGLTQQEAKAQLHFWDTEPLTPENISWVFTQSVVKENNEVL